MKKNNRTERFELKIILSVSGGCGNSEGGAGEA